LSITKSVEQIQQLQKLDTLISDFLSDLSMTKYTDAKVIMSLKSAQLKWKDCQELTTKIVAKKRLLLFSKEPYTSELLQESTKLYLDLDNALQEFIGTLRSFIRTLDRTQKSLDTVFDATSASLSMMYNTLLASGVMSILISIFTSEYLRKLALSEKTALTKSNTDFLTSIHNRSGLESESLYYLDNPNESGILLMLDLNKFKQVNDRYGHTVGDYVLKVIAKRLQGRLRAKDSVARIGGDEFVIFCPDMKASGVQNLIGEIKVLISLPIMYNNDFLEVGSSIGVSYFPKDGKTLEELCDIADKSMYKDKKDTPH
jgi:diguanylate cyclase (GGDEF)-like protein